MSNQSNSEIVESVHEHATSLEDQIEKLEQFRSELDSIEKQVDRMDERERDAFYSNGSSLRTQVDNLETVDELLELDHKIEELVRSPLREAALAEFDSFLDLVDPQLSKDTHNDVREKLENSISEDLEEITSTYQELPPKIESLPSFLQDQISSIIEDRPSILIDPSNELSDIIEMLKDRQSALEDFDECISDSGGWTPNYEFATEPRLYGNLKSTLNTDQTQSTFSDIDEILTELSEHDLHISDLVQDELERELENTDPDVLMNPFTDIRSDLTILRNIYLEVSDWVVELEEFGANQGLYETEINEILTEYPQLDIRAFDSVEAIRQRCGSLKSDILNLGDNCAEKLSMQRKMLDDLEEDISGSAPDVDFKIDGSGKITTESVREDLSGALNAISTYQDWSEEAFSNLGESFGTEDAFEIWQQLYDGDRITLTQDNKETIFALTDRFTIQVVLGGE